MIINTTGEEIHDDRVVAVDARLSERGIESVRQKAVSYTHLDVYKRQL